MKTPSLVTIFGGSGFVGRYVVQELARAGYRIKVANRHPHQSQFLRAMGNVGQIELVGANITRPHTVRAAISGAEYVVNLCGILYETRAQSFKAVQLDGAVSLAEACHAQGVRHFVHISAAGLSLETKSIYGQTKLAAQKEIHAILPKATIICPVLVFGHEDNFFNRFAAMARILHILPLIGGGHNETQLVYVADIARAIRAILANPQSSHGQIYDLATPDIYSFQELMKMILQIIERRAILLPVPVWAARVQGLIFENLARIFPLTPPLTSDMVALLEERIIANPAHKTFADLGISPTLVEAILPDYLARFRPDGGQGS